MAVRLVLLLALATLALPSGAGETDSAQRELDDLTGRLNALDSWLDDAGKRLATQQRQVAQADRKIADAAQRIRQIGQSIAETEAALAELSAEQQGLGSNRDRQARRIAEHLREAWKLSQGAAMKTLLNQEDAATAERMMRYHGYFAAMHARAIDDYRATLAALRQTERQVRSKQQALAESRAELATDRTALVAERGNRRRLIAELESDVSDKESQRKQLEDSRRRLQDLVEELARKASAAPRVATAIGRGTLPWPVRGDVHRRFGQARAGGRMRWQGLYILAPAGAPVRAVAAGEVVFADWLRGFGLLAIVDHGDNRLSLYGYADALYKRAGERVEGGETIAAVGQSGGQAEVGLYFEIRLDGAPTDPLGWLQP